MKRFCIIFLIFAAGTLYSQSERLQSMGSLKFSLPDYQYSLNPFDFGGNPAWLYMDEKDSWLKIIPGYSGYNGDYKRRFDPKSENLYSVKFAGVKTLGEDGTFMGETSYEYELRKEVPRSLKFNTYSGEAFFFTDTTTGNFRYNGPSMKFSYSFEPVERLFTGASVSYRILDGLKNVYSRAEVLFREIEGNFGAAYNLSDKITLGANYIYKNTQENIASKSEDLMEVEVFNFKGETYSISKRESEVSQKIAGNVHIISGQIYYRTASSEIGLIGSTLSSGQKVLMSYAVTGQSFKEYEEGYASFNNSSIELRARHELLNNFYVGITGGYNHRYVWSENSPKDRLLWEWTINSVSGGAGFSYKPSELITFAAEYEYAKLDIDSSKYIDTRFFNGNSADHAVRTGIEYQLLQDIYLRGGYKFNLFEKDIVYGGDDISMHSITAGLGLYVFNSLGIDIHLEYGFYKGLPENFKRSNYSAFTTIKLYSF